MVISHEALKYVISWPFSGTPLSWKSSILRFVVTELGKARRSSSQYDSDRLSTRRNRVCEMGIHAAEKKLTCHRWWRGKESSWIPKVELQVLVIIVRFLPRGGEYHMIVQMYVYDCICIQVKRYFGAQFAMFATPGWVNWSSNPKSRVRIELFFPCQAKF